DLPARGIPSSPVEGVGDLVSGDAGMQAHFVRLDHPEGIDLLVQHEPITWEGQRLPITRAPLMGEHSQEVLHDLLALDEEQFTDLLVSGVIR
ncbi:MAG: hypothetical protein ACR2PL_04005, partial [Dehalococcoidia bacterium]